MFRWSIPLDWVPMGINHTPNIWLTVQLWLIDQENKRSKDSMHFLRLGIQKFICITTDDHWPKKLKPQYMNLQHDSHRSFQLAMRKTRCQHSINKYIHTYTCMYPFYCGNITFTLEPILQCRPMTDRFTLHLSPSCEPSPSMQCGPT